MTIRSIQSTQLIIGYRTTADPRQFATPVRLNETMPVVMLQAVVLAFCVSLMTADWLAGGARVAVVNGLFVVVMAVIFGCVGIAYVEGLWLGLQRKTAR